MKFLRYLIILLLLGCSTPTIQAPEYYTTPLRQTATYEARWFRYSEFEWRYIASDVMVAIVSQAGGAWYWVVCVPWNGDYLIEQPISGYASTDELAKHYAEKRMYGTYWM